MKKAILLVAVVTALTVFAERQYLWPEGKMPDAQPHQFATMRNVATRTMRVVQSRALCPRQLTDYHLS